MDIATKNSLLAQLRVTYNNDVTNIYNYYLGIINDIYNKFLINRNSMIRSYIAKYYNDVSVIRNKYNIDVQAILNTPTTLYSNKRALLIGMNYTGTSYQLAGCLNDINQMEAKLSKTYGFSSIIKMHDTSTILPTKVNILGQLVSMLTTSVSGDVLLFHYSGHGSQLNDVTGDEIDGRDEVMIPSDYFTNNSIITDDEIKVAITQNLKSGVKLIVVLDCCHSGTMFDLKYNFKSDWSSLVNTFSTDTSGDIILISGCADPQSTYDTKVNSVYQGSTTYSFLQCIKSTISWKQLIINMRQTLVTIGLKIQVPQISSGRSFDINSLVTI